MIYRNDSLLKSQSGWSKSNGECCCPYKAFPAPQSAKKYWLVCIIWAMDGHGMFYAFHHGFTVFNLIIWSLFGGSTSVKYLPHLWFEDIYIYVFSISDISVFNLARNFYSPQATRYKNDTPSRSGQTYPRLPSCSQTWQWQKYPI